MKKVVLVEAIEALWKMGVNIDWIAKMLSKVLERDINPDDLLYPDRKDFSDFEKEVEGK